MPRAKRVFRNLYRDSVSLMQLSAKLGALAGVRQASAIMATAGNLDLLREAGLAQGDVAAARTTCWSRSRARTTMRLMRRLPRPRPSLPAGCAASGRPAPHAAAQSRDGAAGGRERQPRPDLDARRLCGRRGDEGASTRPQRHAVQRQRLARRRDRAQALRALARAPGHGAGLRHGDHRRRAARLCQRGAARRDRRDRGIRHRPAAGHLPDRSLGRGSRRRSAPAATTCAPRSAASPCSRGWRRCRGPRDASSC